jgi:glyoxylase-like metal-dependent hydrolase (beta-lactamase superfamily II)/rhodanese-related sulfurtransferase
MKTYDISQLNPHACRTYCLTVPGGTEAVLIDPVLDHVDDYVEYLKTKKLKLKMVIDTHTHADHISAGPSLKDKTGCSYAMHETSPVHCADLRLHEGSDLTLLGSIKVRCIATPGHTKDSLSLVLEDAVFTGDALFLDDGGAGRDDLPGGDPGDHWDSLEKLKKLDDALIVYPAHDYRNREPSSLGEQKKTNPHLEPRSREEFIQYSQDLKLGPADWMVDVLKANYACARDPGAAWIPVDTPACEVKGTLEPGVNEIEVEAVDVKYVGEAMNSGKDVLLLDVRDPEELIGPLGSLAGVKNIPVQHLAHRLADLEASKEKDIVTVCRSGARAHTAAQILLKAGFTGVRVLEGGMIAWREMEG